MLKLSPNFYQLVGDCGVEAARQDDGKMPRELARMGFYGVYPQDLFCVMNGADYGTLSLFSCESEQLNARKTEEVQAYTSLLKAHGLTLESAHYGQTLPPPGEPVEWIFPRHDALVQLAVAAGLKRITTHIGWMYGLLASAYTGTAAQDFYNGEISLRGLHAIAREAYGGYDAMYRDSIAAYQYLCRKAAEAGITVTLETSCVEMLEVNTNAEQIKGFIRDVGADNLAVCLDPGHCQWNGICPVSLSRDLGSLIVEVHFHDNKGDHDSHMPLGCGTIDWHALANTLINIDYRGTITFEQSDHATNQTNWLAVVKKIEQDGA